MIGQARACQSPAAPMNGGALARRSGRRSDLYRSVRQGHTVHREDVGRDVRGELVREEPGEGSAAAVTDVWSADVLTAEVRAVVGDAGHVPAVDLACVVGVRNHGGRAGLGDLAALRPGAAVRARPVV